MPLNLSRNRAAGGNAGQAGNQADSAESARRFEGNTCGAGLKEGRAITRALAHLLEISPGWSGKAGRRNYARLGAYDGVFRQMGLERFDYSP